MHCVPDCAEDGHTPGARCWQEILSSGRRTLGSAPAAGAQEKTAEYDTHIANMDGKAQPRVNTVS